MAIVKTYAKGQIIIPKGIRECLGIKPGKRLSLTVVGNHAELRPLPDDPIEFLTGIYKKERKSFAHELLKERKKDNKIDEEDSL